MIVMCFGFTCYGLIYFIKAKSKINDSDQSALVSLWWIFLHFGMIDESRQTKFCSDGLIDLGERGNNNTLNSFKNDPCPYSDLPCNDDFLENETIFNADKAHAYKDAFYHSMVWFWLLWIWKIDFYSEFDKNRDKKYF